MVKSILLLSFLLGSFYLYGKPEEDAKKIIDYQSIKNILKNDMLDIEIDKKNNEKKLKQEQSALKEKSKYQIPDEDEYWSFFSEYWLVKNAQILKWDFEKPDYGLKESIATLFEKLGLYEKKFKLLLINTSTIAHMGLPSNKNEYIFVLSLPFVRSLDLSKLEISLLLFEDLIRLDQNYFKNYLTQSKITKMIGKSFYKNNLSSKDINDFLNLYDQKVFDQGFSFKEQFEVTQKVDKILKGDMNLWSIFLEMKKKTNNLVKTNALYKTYAKIYPSPELQINWLSPGKKNE